MVELYSCQCLNTKTSAQSNKGYTTETPSISYNTYLYIKLVVILQFASLIIDEDNFYWTWSLVFNANIPISTHSILDLFLSLEIMTTWQTDSTVHKLKPRSFHKSVHLWVHLADFYSQCEPYLILTYMLYLLWATWSQFQKIVVVATTRLNCPMISLMSKAQSGL